VALVTADATRKMFDRWDQAAASGQTIDVASEMKRLTCAIAACTFFGSDVSNDVAIIEESLEALLDYTWSRLQSVLDLSRFLPTPKRKRFHRALTELNRIVNRIIDERTGSGNQTNLLSMLLAARDETGEGLSSKLLREETITMLLAGHETTASSLARTFYLLSEHPAAQQRLGQELDKVLRGRVPTAADLSQLTYTASLFQESLRLYPPIWIIERRVIEADVIGGYHIPRGSSVVISPYALHRHPELWEDAQRFDPDRFSPERLGNITQHAYIPFGVGGHQCIGKDFAVLEAHMIIAQVAQRYRLQQVAGHPCILMPGITLGLKHGLKMKLTMATKEHD
jgi:cytochrome P450